MPKPQKAPGLDSRDAWWKKQAKRLTVAAETRAAGDQDRQQVVAALGKVLAASGYDLEASTKEARAEFEKRCAEADRALEKRGDGGKKG